MGWSESARATIKRVGETIPKDATLNERKKIIDAAYPFGEREMWPYKAWLKARKDYLRQYGYGPPLPIEEYLSPLQRMMKKAGK